jgi:hypothetical protein
MDDFKSILDARFKYVPAGKTDLEKTFNRIRKEQAKAKEIQTLQEVRTFNNVIVKKFK